MAKNKAKMNKFVTGVATAAMVATAVVPVASAAGFNDLGDNVDAGVKADIDKAVTLGFFKEAAKFNPSAQITRGQAALTLARYIAGGDDQVENYAIEHDLESKVTLFNDIPVSYKTGQGFEKELYYASLVVKNAGAFTQLNLNPAGPVTRSQMAKIVTQTFGLEKAEDYVSTITDIDHLDAATKGFIETIASQNVTIVNKFMPAGAVTRSQMASFLVRANDAANPTPEPEITDVKVQSVTAITSTGVTVAIEAPTKDVVDAEVVVKDAAGKVVPTTKATVKAGATEATFSFVTPLTVSPTSLWTVNGVAYKVANFGIIAVETADSYNKNIVVEFNSPITSLDASEIVIREKVAQTRAGIASVTLAKDGMSASVQLIGFGDASVAGLKSQTVYTFSITQAGKVTSSDFEIPAVVEDAVVRTVNPSTRTITVAPKNATGAYGTTQTVTVPKGLSFDFQEALGRDLTIWKDKNNSVTKFVYNDETVVYDAIEYVTKTINGVSTTVLKTLSDGATHEIASGAGNIGVQSTNKVALDSTVGNKDNYAKIVLGSDGKAKSIIAHDLNNSILVEKVANDTVTGYGLAASLKDYTILKGGKTITTADLKAGDVVYYNTGSKVAEVYNNTVSGKVTAFFDKEIQLEGKSYNITNAQGVINGNFTSLNNNNVAAFTNVTAHLNRAGELTLLTGERSEVASATSVAFAKEDISTFNFKGVDFMKLVTQKADGSAVTEEVDVTKLKSLAGVTVDAGGFTTLQTTAVSSTQPITVSKVLGFFYAKDAADNDDLKLFAAKDVAGNTISATKNTIETTGFTSGTTNAFEVTLPTIVEDALTVTKAGNDVTGLNFLLGGAQVDEMVVGQGIKLTDKALTDGTNVYQLSSSVPVFIKDKLATGQTTQTYTSTTWGALDKNISKINEDNSPTNEFTVYGDGNGNAKYIVLDEVLIQAPDANNKFEGVISEIKYGTQTTPEVSYVKFAGDSTQYKFVAPETTQYVVGQVLNVEAKDSVILAKTADSASTSATGQYSATNQQIADGEFRIGSTDGYELANSFTKVYEVTGTGLNQQLVERTYADLINLNSNQYIEASLIAAGSKKVDAIVIRTVGTPAAPNAISFTNAPLNASNANAATIDFTAPAGSSVAYSVTDGTTTTPVVTVGGTGTNQTVTVDVSSLANGPITVNLAATTIGGTSTTSSQTTTLDKVAPTAAWSTTGDGDGAIVAGEKLVLTFSEAMDPLVISAANIDTVLAPNNSHSHKDGAGAIGSAVWSAGNTVLTITYTAGTSAPTIVTSDTITINGLKDVAGNAVTTVSPYTVLATDF